MANNTSVVSISVQGPLDVALFGALAAALPSNSTLRDLSLLCGSNNAAVGLSPVFLALGKNTGLKTLKVDVSEARDGSLCTATKDGLGINETLESLELKCVPLCDDNSDLWYRALSFLHTNNALKSLVVTLDDDVTESCLSAFRIDIATMLQDNASLETLSIPSLKGVTAEHYFALVTALQHNTTLKTLNFHNPDGRFQLDDDEFKQLASLLKKTTHWKNYQILVGLEMWAPSCD
jgi:hypothetical protein